MIKPLDRDVVLEPNCGSSSRNYPTGIVFSICREQIPLLRDTFEAMPGTRLKQKMAGEIVASVNSVRGRILVSAEKDGSIHERTGAEAEKIGEDMAKLAWSSVRPQFSIFSRSVATIPPNPTRRD